MDLMSAVVYSREQNLIWWLPETCVMGSYNTYRGPKMKRSGNRVKARVGTMPLLGVWGLVCLLPMTSSAQWLLLHRKGTERTRETRVWMLTERKTKNDALQERSKFVLLLCLFVCPGSLRSVDWLSFHWVAEKKKE